MPSATEMHHHDFLDKFIVIQAASDKHNKAK